MTLLRNALLRWYRLHGRDLPFRRTADPYAILVSEIMLQQTQVDRVVPKWKAWLLRFPNWRALACAPRSDVLRFWSGLGYNNRAIRLQALAKIVVEEHAGKLPEVETELIKLPGIGPYTAGAIRVFAFDKQGSCVDVNIERVLMRAVFRKTERPVRGRMEQELFVLLGRRPRDVGNALMDLGSLVCTPTGPRCGECPVRASCKSKGERPDEKKAREKKRQSPFLHSNRWWRGQILRLLAENDDTCGADELFLQIPSTDKTAFDRALAELRREKVVEGRRLRIAD